MSAYTEHIAGSLTSGVQRCTRCNHILCDYRNSMSPSGSATPQGFPPGAVYMLGGITTTTVPRNVTINECAAAPKVAQHGIPRSTSRMIVSTSGLAHILKDAPVMLDVSFRIKRHKKSDHGLLYVSSHSPGLAYDTPHRRFQDFTVPYHHAIRLAKVLVQLEEQPITLEWDGDRFILHHVEI